MIDYIFSTPLAALQWKAIVPETRNKALCQWLSIRLLWSQITLYNYDLAPNGKEMLGTWSSLSLVAFWGKECFGNLCREIGKSKMPAAILLKLSLLQQWEKNQCKEKEELESSPHQPHHQPEPKKNQQRHPCGLDVAFHNVLQRYMECESVCCCICLLSGRWSKTHLIFMHSFAFIDIWFSEPCL